MKLKIFLIAWVLFAGHGKASMTRGLDAFKTEVFNTSISGTIFLHQAPRYRSYLSIGMAYFHYSAKNGNDNQLYYTDGSKVGGHQSTKNHHRCQCL
ncbi:hypothetical protein GWO43_25540 [candidate division KSB1 bacterium]|nr:hypothetical protein [candidate division KSB1 bacterium]NIR68959.1 hypothetical protein [candidate division KSB1 bacterium]NIS27296.1 hypothetical protein [candidate division KSB1 bacterium]NIT74175.1 hypothetical protein [candidate division KSB1 bacterium]NIU28026.1 hypothetical protein [candidate division KSB1 bacterium]